MADSVINDSIRKRIERIEACLKKLEKKRQLTLDEFLADSESQDVVLYNFQIAIDSCLDIGSQIIAERGWRAAETYADIPKILVENKVIPKEYEETFVNMAKFRNVIVHEYLYVDLVKVYYNLLKVEDIKKFLLLIEEFLEKK